MNVTQVSGVSLQFLLTHPMVLVRTVSSIPGRFSRWEFSQIGTVRMWFHFTQLNPAAHSISHIQYHHVMLAYISANTDTAKVNIYRKKRAVLRSNPSPISCLPHQKVDGKVVTLLKHKDAKRPVSVRVCRDVSRHLWGKNNWLLFRGGWTISRQFCGDLTGFFKEETGTFPSVFVATKVGYFSLEARPSPVVSVATKMGPLSQTMMFSKSLPIGFHA